jgi:predicted dehydrogenase
MKKIRYGIIGFGAFAERAIMPAIRLTSNSELVAIQKRSLDSARSKGEEHSIPLYFDSVEAIVSSKEVDAVFIVSANSHHHRETLLAARAKKHVIVEKPMAVNFLQAKEMIEVCEANNVKFMTGHMLRFSPLLQRMKEIVTSGIIGEITFAQSHFVYDAQLSQRSWLLDKKNAGGGPLFDIGIHCLDSMRFVLNDDQIVKVNNFMNPQHTETGVEKTSLLSCQFSKGTIGSVYSSYESSYRQSFIEFFGTKGSISAYYFTPSNTPTTLEIKIGKGGLIESVKQEEILVPNLYELEISHFSNCILNNTTPIVDAECSLHNQHILELALNKQ